MWQEASATETRALPHALHLHQSESCSSMHILFYWLLILGQLCTHAESTWPVVGVVDRCGQKIHYLWHLWAVPNNSKHTEASILLILTDSLCLRVVQMPRSEMWWFSRWQPCRMMTDIQTDHFTFMHAHGVITHNNLTWFTSIWGCAPSHIAVQSWRYVIHWLKMSKTPNLDILY